MNDIVASQIPADLPVRRNTVLLAATMAVNSAVLQLVAAVSSLTFVLVTGVRGLLGLGPAIFLTASALTAVPAGRMMDRVGRTPVMSVGFVLGAAASSGIFVILLGLVAAVLAVVLLILYIVRATVVLILIAGAPLLLITHALPQTDGLARLWWRGMIAALGVQVAQALVLATAVRVFFNSGGRQALGLSVTGNLIDLLVCLCLFWILIRIPFWAKDLAFSGRRTLVGQAARTYVLARVGRKALFT